MYNVIVLVLTIQPGVHSTYVRYACLSVSAIWGGLGTSQWGTADTVWFVRLLAAKDSHAMPVRSTVEAQLLLHKHKNVPKAHKVRSISHGRSPLHQLWRGVGLYYELSCYRMFRRMYVPGSNVTVM